MPKTKMLTDDELLAIITVFIGLGVRQVRLTGGEGAGGSHCCADRWSTWWPASRPWSRGGSSR